MSEIIVRGQEKWDNVGGKYTDLTPKKTYTSLADALKGELDIAGSENSDRWKTVKQAKEEKLWQVKSN